MQASPYALICSFLPRDPDLSPAIIGMQDRRREEDRLLTLDDLIVAARQRGFSLTIKTLGPFYRISCRAGVRLHTP